MIVIGLTVWLLVTVLYAGFTLGVGCALYGVSRRPGRERWTRVLFALFGALLASPAFWTLLYTPVAVQERWVKPRIIEDSGLAYALPFTLVFALAWSLFPKAGKLKRALSRRPSADCGRGL